jgi:type 1 glutamine amidotransferase
MKAIYILLTSVLLVFGTNSCTKVQSMEAVALDEAWRQKIWDLAPSEAQAVPTKRHKVLLFSLFTGYNHWVIPHADFVVQTLADKTGAFETVKSDDIRMFEKEALVQFDAIVLNNNCSIGPRRDLFYDALGSDSLLNEAERSQKASELEKNLLNFVRNGGGLAVIHGGIVMQNNAAEVSEMVGGSFDYHPPQQKIELKIVDDQHPLTLAFGGQSFSHVDEPYIFKNAYHKKRFRPLLYMETRKIEKLRTEIDEEKAYVSWVKRYGDGRVFYCSPSHNAQSYENSHLLCFYLNGLQYVLGDLECDDTPIEP